MPDNNIIFVKTFLSKTEFIKVDLKRLKVYELMKRDNRKENIKNDWRLYNLHT